MRDAPEPGQPACLLGCKMRTRTQAFHRQRPLCPVVPAQPPLPAAGAMLRSQRPWLLRGGQVLLPAPHKAVVREAAPAREPRVSEPRQGFRR